MVKYIDENGLIYYTSKIKGIRDSLQGQIDDIKGIGRFLSNWSCRTGKPMSEPPGLSPGDSFSYRTGDYYLVSEIANQGGTNYRPNGGVYIVGSVSSTIETDDVSIGDMYIYDSQKWLLLYNTQKTVSFVNIAGSPYDNTNLAGALNSKQNEITVDNKLSADLVDDTSTTNKFVTASDKTNWNNMVPQTRTINNKALSSDITLNASDVSATLVEFVDWS